MHWSMVWVKKIAALLLLVAGLAGCQKDASRQQMPEQQNLTVLFAPGSGFSGAGYDDTILNAVMESAATAMRTWPGTPPLPTP